MNHRGIQRKSVLTRSAAILDANTMLRCCAKSVKLSLSNPMDRQLFVQSSPAIQETWRLQTNQHPARVNGPCAVGPKDVFCLASGAKSSKAEPLHLEGIQIGGICTSGGSWMSARRKKAAAR